MVSAALTKVVEVLATLASCYLFFSLTPELRRVHSERSIASMPLLPILAMFANCVCWVQYGIVIADYFPLMITNVIGLFFTLGYLGVYFKHAAEFKSMVLRQFGLLVLVLAAIAIYCALSPSSNHSLKLQTGYLACVVSAILFGSPLVVLKRVVEDKNSAHLPLTMVFSGLANSVLWVAYGFIVSDPFVYAPNSVNLVIGLVQLGLVIYFPKRPIGPKDEDLETGDHHASMVIVSPVPGAKETAFTAIKSPNT